MTQLADLGVFGLSTMGANLARNAARNGFGVALFNRHAARTDELVAEHRAEGASPPPGASPTSPRRSRSLAPSSSWFRPAQPVDDVIEDCCLISRPATSSSTAAIRSSPTPTGARKAEREDIRFVGMGVSGGEEGALLGPSMMPGGDETAYRRIEPIVTKMAAHVDGEPCCAYIGPGGRWPLRQDGAQRH